MQDKLTQVQEDVASLKDSSKSERRMGVKAKRMLKAPRPARSRVALIEDTLPPNFHAWSVSDRKLYMRREKNHLDRLAVRPGSASLHLPC